MKSIPLYDGALQANHVGSFVKGGEGFDIVRPGYDAQGNRRQEWTQIVHKGVPVFEHKMMAPLPDILARFDALWAKWIGDDKAFLDKVLIQTKKARLKTFRDGVTGKSPAPALTIEGREQGRIYSA